MAGLHFDPTDSTDAERRRRAFSGQILVYPASRSTVALCDSARDAIQSTFPGRDPQTAQFDEPVEKFVALVGPLKSRFTNGLRTKELVRDVLAEFGCELDKTYFDVPRLRVVTSDSYLTAGVGYAYKPHRDTWYASPTSQINWWFPVYAIEEERALALYPSYWDRPIRNLSREFDHDEWCRVGRQQAATQIKTDTRRHPLPEEDIDPDSEVRIVTQPGSAIYFSAAHLHGTVPNTSGLTRFSIDFRTVHLDDVLGNAGAPNPDSEATGTTTADLLRAADFAAIPEEAVRRELSSVDV